MREAHDDRASDTPRMPRKVDTQVLSRRRPTAASATATSASMVTSGGMNPATTESTSGAANASVSAARTPRRWRPGAPRPDRDDLESPAAQASAASAPSASELPTTATRGPAGSGWCTTSWATSNIWWMFSTRMTPAW